MYGGLCPPVWLPSVEGPCRPRKLSPKVPSGQQKRLGLAILPRKTKTLGSFRIKISFSIVLIFTHRNSQCLFHDFESAWIPTKGFLMSRLCRSLRRCALYFGLEANPGSLSSAPSIPKLSLTCFKHPAFCWEPSTARSHFTGETQPPKGRASI